MGQSIKDWEILFCVAVYFNEDLMDKAKEWARKRGNKSHKIKDFIWSNLDEVLYSYGMDDIRIQYFKWKRLNDTF